MATPTELARIAIPGYERTYAITRAGDVYSTPRPTTPGGLLKWSPDNYGYPRVTLVQDGRQRKVRVHLLVMLTFVGPTPRGMEIRHLDGDPTNPRLDNLAFGTHAENMADMVRHGRSTAAVVCKRGHLRTGANLGARNKSGGRPCLACQREQYHNKRAVA